MGDGDYRELGACQSGELRLGAVLLSAGEGARLGCRPKALIHAAGETLLQRNLRLLRDVGVKEVVVVTGHYRDELAPVLAAAVAELSDLLITEVTQPTGSHSQAASLRLAVKGLTVQSDAVLVLPVDMPLLTRADLVAVVSAYKHAPELVEFVGPNVGGRPGNPVLFSHRIAARVARGEGAFGSGAWRHASSDWVLEWQTENTHYLADIDTPEDLVRWADEG